MKGHPYDDIPAIKTAVTQQLHSIPENAFQTCFKDLQKSWQQYINVWGAYFRGG
jgi:hypothetical protein